MINLSKAFPGTYAAEAAVAVARASRNRMIEKGAKSVIKKELEVVNREHYSQTNATIVS